MNRTVRGVPRTRRAGAVVAVLVLAVRVLAVRVLAVRVLAVRVLAVLVLAVTAAPLLSARASEDASLAPRLVVQRRHGGRVTALAYTPDGRFLLTGAGDDTAMLWDTGAWRLVRRFEAGTGGAVSVALTGDATRVLLAGGDAPDARLLDAITGEVLGRPAVASGRVTGVALSSDGETLVLGDGAGALHVFAARSLRRPRQRLTPHTQSVRALRIVDRLDSVFSVSDDGSVCRTPLSGRKEARYEGHEGTVLALAVARDADVLVTGGADGTVRVWDVADARRPRHVLRTQGRAEVRGVAVSPDGQVVYAADAFSKLWAWDVASGVRKIYEVEVPSASGLTALALSPDGRRLVTGQETGAVHVMEADTGVEVTSHGLAAITPKGVQFSPDGHWFACSVGPDSKLPRVDLWDLASGQRLTPMADGNGVACFAISPDALHLAIGAYDGGVRIWDVVRRKIVHLLPRQDTAICALAWVGEGRMVTGAAGGAVLLWDVEGERRLGAFSGHAADIRQIAVSPRGDRMATVSMDRQARLWDVEAGTLIRVLDDLPNPVAPVFTPDGSKLVVRTDDLVIGVLDAAKGRLLRTFPDRGRRRGDPGHTQAITCLRVSPDGKRVVSGSWDKTLRVWNLETGRVEHVLIGHEDDVVDVAVSPDGRHVASTGTDLVTHFWDLGTGRLLCTIAVVDRGESVAPIPGAPPPVPDSWIVFDAGGRFDATGIPLLQSVNWVSGLRTFALDDLAESRHDPGLLAKCLGRSPITPRPVEDLAPPAPPPTVEAQAPPPGSTVVRVQVENQGGGIGPVGVKLNGREVVEDARGETVASDAERERLEVDLARAPNLLPGAPNTVEVSVYDAERTSRRRGRLVRFDAPGTPLPDPELWGVVCGVSDYAGHAIDLGFPARDAAAFADALRLAGTGLFGTDKTHVTLLASPAPDGAKAATRANLLEALEVVVSSAKANDVVCLYVAGHGVVTGGDEPSYRYLLAGAESLRADALDAVSVTGADLAAALARTRANHRALFLDTCAAGEVRDALLAAPPSAGLPEATVRRFRDREGVFVLAGCAADRVSYESSIYGQGLLTYALLYGMSCGCHFKDGVYVDVGRLMAFACELVPFFSRQMGLPSPQLPVKAEGDVPFSLGKLDEEARARIPVAQPVPGVVRSSFQRQSPPTDSLGLSVAVDRAVQRLTGPEGGRAPLAFVETSRMTRAYQLAGRYTVRSGEATVETYLIRMGEDGAHDEEVARFEVSGPCDGEAALAALADAVVAHAIEALGAK